MTQDAATTSSTRVTRVAGLLGGALMGALLACMVKGTLIGIDQMDSGFGWLSVPIDAISGVGLLFVDMLMLTSPNGVAHVVVLPWAAAGLTIGAYVGWRSARTARR